MTQPINQDLERHIIGNVMCAKSLDYQTKRLSVLDFGIGTNQQIWSVYCEMDEDGEAIDIPALHVRLFNKFPDFCLRMSDLTNYTWGLTGVTQKKDIDNLKTIALQRLADVKARQIADKAQKQASIDELILDAETLLETLRAEQGKENGNARTLAEVFEQDVFSRLDKFVANEMVKIPFGFAPLDDSTNGGAGLGELTVIGAKPKEGKSVMAANLADNVSALGIGTYYCSREMLNFENAFRILARNSNYNVNNFRGGMFTSVAESLKFSARSISERPLLLDDRSKTVAEAKKEIKRVRENGIDLRYGIFDYAQLLRSAKTNNRSKADIIEEIIYDLKDLAMELEMAVVCVSQFNADGIKAVKPTMNDFHGSSAIAKAANLVLLWTLEKEVSGITGGRNGELWIEAGRSVAFDNFDITFRGEKATFMFL